MGYSCTADAGNMLGVIEHIYATNNDCTMTIDGNQFFFERGKEQSDGAVTGYLMLCIPKSAYCSKVGNVRIEPNGTITRFPRIDKKFAQ
jgi:hypothetical protein